MKKTVAIALSMIALVGVLFSSLHMGVSAQDDNTPPPPAVDTAPDVFKYDEPAFVEGGDSEWTLNRTQFVNQFPDGFIFLGNATSTGGPLVSASIIFSHNPDYEDNFRVRGDVDPETGEMRVDVTGTAADDIPSWLPINYRWRIGDEAGTTYFSEWIVGEVYADNTRGWSQVTADDYQVFFQEGLPGNVGDVVAQRLRENIPIMTEHFGEALAYAPRIILYRDLETFNEWQSFNVGAGGGIRVGTTREAWGATVQFYFQGDVDELANTVVHEFAHLYQAQVWETGAPGWFLEGQATYFEYVQDYDYRSRAEFYAERNQIPRIFNDGAAISVPELWPDGTIRLWYDMGYTFFVYLVDTYGIAAHREINQRMGDEDLDATNWQRELGIILEEVTATDLEKLQTNWRIWLGAPGTAATLIPSPTIAFNFPPTVTPFGQ